MPPVDRLLLQIDVAPEAHLTVFGYIGLKGYVTGLFEWRVDVVSRDRLKPMSVPPRRPAPIYAF